MKVVCMMCKMMQFPGTLSCCRWYAGRSRTLFSELNGYLSAVKDVSSIRFESSISSYDISNTLVPATLQVVK